MDIQLGLYYIVIENHIFTVTCLSDMLCFVQLHKMSAVDYILSNIKFLRLFFIDYYCGYFGYSQLYYQPRVVVVIVFLNPICS